MLTADQLREQLDYNPETGVFTWKVNRYGVTIGAEAGNVRNDGYILISVLNKRYLAHRLAWLYSNGEWPTSDLDHINGQRFDNRIANLRLANRKQSVANRGPRCDNKLGMKGVYRVGDRFVARIKISGRNIYLGTFDTAEEANEAYRRAALE